MTAEPPVLEELFVDPSEEIDDLRAAIDSFGLEAGANYYVDMIEARIAGLREIDCPTDHVFTPGLYVRTIFMHEGTMLTSKIHKTEHPFVIHRGDVSVWTKEDGVVRLQGPFIGTTKPGTRRILFIHKSTVWSTFHVCSEEEQGNVDLIEKRIIEPHSNPFLQPAASPCLN